MSDARIGMGNFVVLAAAGIVTTIQAGIIALLYRKCVKLSNRLSILEEQNSQSVRTLRTEVNGLRNAINLLEKSITEGRPKVSFNFTNKPALKSTEESLKTGTEGNQKEAINRADSVNSVSEGEYADAVDDLSYLKSSNNTMNDAEGATGAHELESSLHHMDRLHETGKHSQAYDELIKLKRDSDPEVLWRLARACHQITLHLEQKNPRKKELLDEAHRYATSAYIVRENDFNVLKWTAAVTGSRTDFLGVREKIEQGNIFKDLLDKALAIDPKECALLHMRGRFFYSVAGLSWVERTVASTIFSAPPVATYDDAIKDFLVAAELKPDWTDNLLFLGKAYLAKGDKQNALLYLSRAATEATNNLDDDSEEEPETVKEAKALLKKHKK